MDFNGILWRGPIPSLFDIIGVLASTSSPMDFPKEIRCSSLLILEPFIEISLKTRLRKIKQFMSTISSLDTSEMYPIPGFFFAFKKEVINSTTVSDSTVELPSRTTIIVL